MRRIGYFEAGDALRGWAVMGVVVTHCASTALFALALSDPASAQALLATGDLRWDQLFDVRQIGAAVWALQIVAYVFFALSAYLLSRPYIAAGLGQIRRAPPAGRYVRHRLGRIVPVFWFMLVVSMVQFGTDGTRTVDLVAAFAFGQSWTAAPFNVHLSQAWTLNIEAAFYVALPIVAAAGLYLWGRGGRWRGPLAFLPMLVVCIVAYPLATTWLPATTPPSQSPIGGLLVFVPGVLVALVEARWGDRVGRLRLAPVVAILLPIGGLLLAYKQLSIASSGSIAERNYLTLAAGMIMAGLVLWQCTERPTWRFMRWRPIEWIGERTFSIYLGHGAVLYEIRDFGKDQGDPGVHFLLLMLLEIPLAILLGAILYQFIERPFIRLSRKERPLFRAGPVVRVGSEAPTIGSVPEPVPVAGTDAPDGSRTAQDERPGTGTGVTR